MSRSSSSASGYSLTDIQLKKLCHDIYIGLDPDNKTLSNISNIKDSIYKVIYMNEDQCRVMSVLPSTSKQINQALEKLLKECFIVEVKKYGVKNYMRNSKSEPFENPYNDDDINDEEDENDEDDDNNEEDGHDDVDVDNDGDDNADEEDAEDNDNDATKTDITDGTNSNVEGLANSTSKKRARKARAPKDPTAPKKIKKKETNPLKRKINPDLLGALANAGVFIMEGAVVLQSAALEAAEKIEKGIWHTSMRPRAQKQQQTIQGAFQKQTRVIVEGEKEHFTSQG